MTRPLDPAQARNLAATPDIHTTIAATLMDAADDVERLRSALSEALDGWTAVMDALERDIWIRAGERARQRRRIDDLRDMADGR